MTSSPGDDATPRQFAPMRYRFDEYGLDTGTFRLTAGRDEIPLEPQVST